MSGDAKNSAFLVMDVGFWILFAWWMLDITRSVEPPSWVIPVGGSLGLINLVWFANGLWQRRASNPDNPNNS